MSVSVCLCLCLCLLSLSLSLARETDFPAGQIFWRSRYEHEKSSDKPAKCQLLDYQQLWTVPWKLCWRKMQLFFPGTFPQNEGKPQLYFGVWQVTQTWPISLSPTWPQNAFEVNLPQSQPGEIYDQRRAAEWRRQKPEASEQSPSGLFQPTPPPPTTAAAHRQMQCENDTEHTYDSDTDVDARFHAQTACRCHASDSPWISLLKISRRGKDKVKVKLYKTVPVSGRKWLSSVAIIWRR